MLKGFFRGKNMNEPICVMLVVTTGDGHFLGTTADAVPGGLCGHGKTSWDVAAEILRRATGLAHGEWAVLRQVGFLDSDGDHLPTVLYALELPEKTSLLHPHFRWSELGDIGRLDRRSIDMIGMACNHIRIKG